MGIHVNVTRTLISLVSAIGLLGAVAVSAQTETPAPLIHVRQTGVLSAIFAETFIGIQNGYFNAEGLDLEYVPVDNGRMNAAALVAGQAQFADITVADVTAMQTQGKDAILFYNIANRPTMTLVVSNEALAKTGVSRQSPIIERYRALKGLTLGITGPGSQGDLYMRYLIKQGGLDPDKDVNIIPVGNGAALLAAIESGQIDGFMQSPPFPLIAVRDGKAQVLIMNSAGDVPEFRNFAFTCIGVSRAWAEKHPEVVEGYSRAMDKAYAFIVEHPDEAVEMMHDHYFPDTPIETLRISLLALLPAFQRDGIFTEESIKNQANVLVALGSIDTRPDVSEGLLWTNQWNPDTLTDQILPTVEAFDGSVTETPTAEATAAR